MHIIINVNYVNNAICLPHVLYCKTIYNDMHTLELEWGNNRQGRPGRPGDANRAQPMGTGP